MALEFRRSRWTRPFCNPFSEFIQEDQHGEMRWDPLLGHVSVYNPALEDKVRVFFGEHDWELVGRLADEGRAACFMCPERVRSVTPRYPDDLVPGGRLLQGGCTLFPNLFPLAEYHAVVAVGEAHFRRLDDFSPSLIEEALGLTIEFVSLVSERVPEIEAASVCANYLLPAGASLIHPHFQVVMGSSAMSFHDRQIAASRSFFREHRRSYWDVLCEEEAACGERFLAHVGRSSFLAAFSPMGTNEILAVTRGADSLRAITSGDVSSLARGLSAVLHGYHAIGSGTFNLAIYFPSLRGQAPWFPLLMRVIARQNLYSNYRTDDFFLQRLLGGELILMPPEKLAAALRSHFKGLV